jgi:hypothetical protein
MLERWWDTREVRGPVVWGRSKGNIEKESRREKTRWSVYLQRQFLWDGRE